MTCKARADFHFFHRRGGKILGGVQVICNMPFLILRKGHEMAKQSAPGRVKQHSSGVKHFLEGLRKIYEGFNPPPNPPRKSAHGAKMSGKGHQLFLSSFLSMLRGQLFVLLSHHITQYHFELIILFCSLILDKMKDSIIAKVAAQTSDFYSSAVQAANITAARQLFDKVNADL